MKRIALRLLAYFIMGSGALLIHLSGYSIAIYAPDWYWIGLLIVGVLIFRLGCDLFARWLK